MNELGDLLRNLRGSRSLREIADITELSHTYISDVEKGYRRGSKKPLHPSPDTLKRLANAYNYSYEEIMKIAGYIEDRNEKNSFLTNDDDDDDDDLLNDLVKVHNGVDSGSYIHVGGQTIDELDQEDRELLLSSIKNTIKLAERLAKSINSKNK